MQISYHPLNNDGADYSGSDTPIVIILRLGNPDVYWDGAEWSSTIGGGVPMTSVGAGDWIYNIDDSNLDTTSRYEVKTSAAATI